MLSSLCHFLPFPAFPLLLSLPFVFFSPASRTWRLRWQGVMSECPGSSPGWPYLCVRTAWCLRVSSFFCLSSLSLPCSCAHRSVPVSFPFACACRGIARWVPLLLFSSYSRQAVKFGHMWHCLRVLTNLVGSPLAVVTQDLMAKTQLASKKKNRNLGCHVRHHILSPACQPSIFACKTPPAFLLSSSMVS